MNINTVSFTTYNHQITFTITGYFYYMLWIRFQVLLDELLKIIFTSNPLEPDPGHASNLSCNFEGDLMIRSGKTNCIYINNGSLWENKPDVELTMMHELKHAAIPHPVLTAQNILAFGLHAFNSQYTARPPWCNFYLNSIIRERDTANTQVLITKNNLMVCNRSNLW